MKPSFVWAAGLAVVVTAYAPGRRALAQDPGAVGAPPDSAQGPAVPAEDAPPEERAEYWFGRGEALGEAGDFVGAAKAFERSVESMRTGEALYNRAIAYEYASMYLEAHAAFEDYRDFLDPRSTEARIAGEAVARIKARLGTIELGFQRDHVPKQIFVDGDPRARDEFPLLVMPGEHEVVVIEKTGEERRRSNTLAPGEIWTVDFASPTQPVQGPAFKPPPAFDEIERERRRRIVRSLFYSSVSLTAAAGITMGVFGGLTLREYNAFADAQCGDASACAMAGNPAYPAEHERAFENYRLTTNVMVGVTAGLAGVSLVLGVVGFSRPRAEQAAANRRIELAGSGLRMRF